MWCCKCIHSQVHEINFFISVCQLEKRCCCISVWTTEERYKNWPLTNHKSILSFTAAFIRFVWKCVYYSIIRYSLTIFNQMQSDLMTRDKRYIFQSLIFLFNVIGRSICPSIRWAYRCMSTASGWARDLLVPWELCPLMALRCWASWSGHEDLTADLQLWVRNIIRTYKDTQN